MSPRPPVWIAVAGNTGSGKSTLAEALSREFSAPLYPESVDDNPYLEPYGRDPERWAFQLQAHFLSHRHRTHLAIEATGSGIQDRTIYEGREVFVPALVKLGRLSATEADTYLRLHEALSAPLRLPQLLVYLRRPVDRCLRQVAQRGRDAEREMPRALFEALHEGYERWYPRYPGPKLLVEGDDLRETIAGIQRVLAL